MHFVSNDRLMRLRFCILSLVVLFASCAKVVMPVGGPRDVTPPTVVKCVPENGTVNFSASNIKITFDEFVVLNNPSENIIISPPLSQQPKYEMKGKTLIINFLDSLIDNSTYNIVFSNGIKDYTEGNLLPIYQYAFSTGESIDSATISGVLLDAETQKPVSNVLVCLYDYDIDSLPFTTLPKYLTKTQTDGSFFFSNIKDGQYKVFAVSDINSNFIFDLPNEGIAFLDTLYSSCLDIRSDSLKRSPLVLRYFIEEDTIQRVSAITSKAKGIYRFAYKLPVRDFHVQPFAGDDPSFYTQLSLSRDTISFYFKEEVLDSIYLLFSTEKRIDTVLIEPYKAPLRQGRGKKSEEPTLQVRALYSGDLFKPLTLQFSYPIRPIDSFPVTFIKKLKSRNDTVVVQYSVPDSFVLQLPLYFPYEEKYSYVVRISDSVFYGYDGTSHDSLTFEFTSKSIRDYGNLQMNYIVSETTDYLIFLLDAQDREVRKDLITSSSELVYNNLVPGNYKIKVVKDLNKNGKWDTGNYKKKRQPEPIYYFEKPIQIRGYWDLEEEFRIGN